MLTFTIFIAILLVCYSFTESSGRPTHNILNNAVDAWVSFSLGSLLSFLLDFLLSRARSLLDLSLLDLSLLKIRWWPFRACLNLHFSVDVDQVDFFILMGSALKSIVKNFEIVVTVARDVHQVLQISVYTCKLLFLRS